MRGGLRRLVPLASALATAILLVAPGASAAPPTGADSPVVAPVAAGDPVLVGAGDIAMCQRTTDAQTAALVAAIPGRVFAAGDLAYPRGTAKQFRTCYDHSWGAFKRRTSPAVGNHEYETRNAAPYFDYFGSRAGPRGKGWYAFDRGTWRVYVLNANCDIVRCGRKSAQNRWLRADLAAHPRACVAAIWHQPLFSSGFHGSSRMVRPLWRALSEAGADIVINGHDHDYERFAPQSIDGVAAEDGMREFVVGTGGAPLRAFTSLATNSEVRDAATYGVLKLTLSPGGYAWHFVPIEGQTWTDQGSATCH